MSDGLILFPLDGVDPKKKESAEYLNQIGACFYQMFNNNGSSGNQYIQFGLGDFARLQMVRDYSNGMQDPQIYMDLYVKKGEEKSGNQSGVAAAKRFSRKGLQNVDWKITGHARLIQATIDSLIGTDKQYINVRSNNPQILNKKMTMRALALYDAMFNEEFKKAGAPYFNNPMASLDQEKLDVFEIMDKFTQDVEIAMKKIADHGFDLSNYTDQIEKRLKRDGTNFAFMLAADISDPYTGAAKCEYVDPTRSILAYLDQTECTDTPFFGKIYPVQVHTLRDMLLSRGAPEDTVEEVLEKAAQSAYLATSSAYLGNSNRPWSYMVERDPLTNRYRYDSISIDIVDFEWITRDTKFVKERNRNGKKEVYPDQWGDWVNNENKKTITYDVHRIIEGLYVPAANYAVGGYQANQKRMNKRKPLLSCCWYKIGGKGMTENAIPRYDQIQIISLKMQNAIRQAKFQGIAVDITALNLGNIGGQMYNAVDSISIYEGNGVLMYKSTLGQDGKYRSNVPIQDLKGGLGSLLTELISAYQHETEMLLQEMGITPAVMASGRAPDLVGLGVQQQQATANALMPLQKGLESVKCQLARNMVIRAVTTMKYDKEVEKYYRNVIGDKYVDAIMTMTDLTFDEVNIALTLKPSPLYANFIMESLKTAQTADRNGNVSIDPNDAIEVIKLIENGNYTEAEKYLKDSIAEKRKSNFEQSSIQSAQQAEQLNQLEIIKAKAEAKKAQEIAAIEIQKYAAMKNIDLQAELKLQQAKTQGKIEEIQTEAYVQSVYDVSVQGGVPKK
jgi:ribosomal protein L22